MDTFEILSQLCNAPCIGNVLDAFDVAEKYLNDFCKIDRHDGMLSASFEGEGKSIMLEAHIDEVGFIVTRVYDTGFLKVVPVGSVDTRILSATPVMVLGTKKLNGVFSSIPPHLSEKNEVPTFDDLFIDIGKDNTQYVKCGDFAVYKSDLKKMLNNVLCSKAFDNRSGVAAVISAAEKINSMPNHPGVTVMLTTGEELGCRGARSGAFALFDKIDLSISVDVSFGNFHGIDPNKTAILGTGAMIGISPVLNKNITDGLKNAAEKNYISHTFEIMSGNTSTNADVISVTKGGIPAALVSIPLRNMHTPCEVISLDDLDAVSNLIACYAVGENNG